MTTSLLLCDDTADIRHFLRLEVSQHSDLKVIGEATNGQEAIDQAELLQPDVMVLDLGMPVLDGLAALPQIRQVAPETRVIAFSGLARSETESAALALGASTFLEKGDSLQDVIAAIRNVMHVPTSGEQTISPEKERRLFDLSLDLLAIVRFDGFFEHLSPSWVRTLGWSIEQLKSRPFADFVHPNDREATSTELAHLADGDSTLAFENRYLCADGSYRWLSWRSISATDGLIYASARDITEQKQVTASRDGLATIVDSAFDAITGMDLDGEITSWNAAAEVMYGFSSEEMLGRNISVIVTDRDECLDLLARARMGEVSRYEAVRETKAGRHIDVWVTASPIRDSEGDVIGSSNITMDISDRKRAEQEAGSLRRDLERRVRERTKQLETKTQELEAKTEELTSSMAELDAFAYTVSHDLRAPLRAMDGFSRILLDDHREALDPGATRYLEHIRANAQGMQNLVDGLLAFSRLGRRALSVVSLSPAVLARQALSDLGAYLDRNRLEITIDEDLPSCLADPTLLKQVYVNLIGNSIKFSKNVSPAQIEIGFQHVDGETAYFVRDNGVGFEPQYADKIFGVFQRLHRAEEFEGTGIGLANVLRIVEKHGGRIWCESQPGSGATFFFTVGTGTDR